MKKLALAAAFVFCTATADAVPLAPLSPVDRDGAVIQVRKGGGSYRSAKSGRFVSGSYGRNHRGTTVKHGKY